MERDQIIRDDFPPSRKGWEPDAVMAHLEAVADSMPEQGAGETSLGDLAATRVRSVLEAAEQAAGTIERSAQSEADERLGSAGAQADQLLADAQARSEQILGKARTDADAHVGEAKRAVEALIGQTEELRAQVEGLGERLIASAPVAEVPGPVIVPEPTPPTIPEPTPDPVPEPTPDPVPEPTPDPEPSPDLPDEPGPIEPPVPEPVPTPPAGETSTEDLIAQLRGTEASAGEEGESADSPDLGAARLVAMNMALDGASRDQISTQLHAEFGELAELDGLLDEVLARAER